MKKIILLVLILLYGYTQIFAVNSIPDLHSIPSENTASPTSATSASSSDIEIGAVHNNYISTTIYNSPLSTGVGYRCKQFLDGLGNPSEMVYVRYTPEKKDLVSMQEGDPLLREDKSWLPLPSSGDLGEYIPVDELRDLTCEYYGDTAPYSKTTYFNDPLKRPRAQALPGEALQSLGKATEFEYRLNWQDEVLRMTVRQSGENFVLDASDFYPAGTLTVTKATDADGRITYVYIDKSERVVLTTAANARTYYGYDAQGRLVIVVTPEGSRLLSPQYRSELRQTAASAATDTAAIEGFVPAALGINDLDPENISFDSSFVKTYCFTYRYDCYGDLVARRFPGGALEEMEYNEKRLLTTRFRGKKDTKGTIEYADRYRYDALNRLVAVSRAYYAVSGSSRTELPSTLVTMVSYYYDSYSNVPSELAYRNDLNSGLVGVSIDYTRLRGLKTYEKVQVLDHKDYAIGYVERAFYYNMEGRLQQIVEKNPLGGIGYFTYAYDFQGNEVFRRERIKPQSGSTEDVLTVLTTYDHAGRVVKEETTFNDSKPVVVNFEYDELGRLVGKDANSITSSYAYNLQGWLTRSSGHHYSSQLKYYDGSNPSYTGNISEWKWGNRSYRFEYDKLGRISDAHYYEGNTLSDDYSEKDISYDLNGNIRSLTRYDAGVPETLDYTYTDGILTAVGNERIKYDGCGNITFNGRNNLEIDYNFLNLPMRIHSTDGQSVVNYRYLADGSKFSATDDTGEGLIYIGSLVYRFRNGAYELDHAAFSQGFFRKNHLIENHEYVPVYYVCDHLGSPRSLIDHTGELMVLRNYYPFGKTWRRSTEPVYYDYYHFNGKEQQTVGDAGLLDYGARFYDPDITRWLTQDLLAETTLNVSPYAYVLNSPVNYVDPFGLFAQVPEGSTPGLGVTPGFTQIADVVVWSDPSKAPNRPLNDLSIRNQIQSLKQLTERNEKLRRRLDGGNRRYGGGGGGSVSILWDDLVNQFSTVNELRHYLTMHDPIIQRIHQAQHEFLNHPVTKFVLQSVLFVYTGGLNLTGRIAAGESIGKVLSRNVNNILNAYGKVGYYGNIENAAQRYRAGDKQGALYGAMFSSIFYWGGMGLGKGISPSENLIFQGCIAPFEYAVNLSFDN